MCVIDGCDKPVIARGWCHSHYKKWQLYGDPLEDRTRVRAPCAVDGCERPTVARGWCGLHYGRWKKHGDVHRGMPPGWGEPRIGKHGYVHVAMPGHPNAWGNGAVAQHVVVMTEMLGRPLTTGESVHHRNGIKHDNRPENLELWAKAHQPGQRVSELIAFAHEILERYADDMQLWPEHLRP